jgi:hypothetical protein
VDSHYFTGAVVETECLIPSVPEVPVSSLVLNVTFDCRDADAVSSFWEAVTGHPREFDPQPGNPYWVVRPPDGGLPHLVFVTVHEEKTIKNRVHVDLVPSGASQEEEVARLLALGANLVDDRRAATPGGWVVMADPEGNEFCVEQPA